MKQSKYRIFWFLKDKDSFYLLHTFWFTQKWEYRNKSCSILLRKKSTAFFGINPDCIFFTKSIFNKVLVHRQQVGSRNIMFSFQETVKAKWTRKTVFMTYKINRKSNVQVWEGRKILSWRSEDRNFGSENNRQDLSGVWLRGENCHHWWLQERNIERVLKSNKYYLIIEITLGCNNKVRKYTELWIYN